MHITLPPSVSESVSGPVVKNALSKQANKAKILKYAYFLSVRVPCPFLVPPLFLPAGTINAILDAMLGAMRRLGMMLGVAGAVREPLMGLHLGGFSGMATGLFTGWVGLVLRPTYGALMSTSQVCETDAGREGQRKWSGVRERGRKKEREGGREGGKEGERERIVGCLFHIFLLYGESCV